MVCFVFAVVGWLVVLFCLFFKAEINHSFRVLLIFFLISAVPLITRLTCTEHFQS